LKQPGRATAARRLIEEPGVLKGHGFSRAISEAK
jgi:hypothetical protein